MAEAEAPSRDAHGRPIYGLDEKGLPWMNALATVMYLLVDPDQRISQTYPRLHRVVRRRFHDAMIARGHTKISRCTHVVGANGIRTDDSERQAQALNLPSNETDRTRDRWRKACEDLTDVWDRTGFYGAGTFASVFSARHRLMPSDLWAIKMERLKTNEMAWRQWDSPKMTRLAEDTGEFPYVPREALLLLLLDQCERFPTLHSVYSCGLYSSTIMEGYADDAHSVAHLTEPLPADYEQATARILPSRTGMVLMDQKRPVLNEIQSCKVASQLLEGFAALRDLNVSHGDLSHNNYMIQEDLETHLIDLGLLSFGLDDVDFQAEISGHIFFREYQLTPEQAMEHTKLFDGVRYDQIPTFNFDCKLPHDARRFHLWHLVCIFYEVLHGYAAWENRAWNPNLSREGNELRKFYRTTAGIDEALARRDRLINEDLPIREDLSQDCADMLRMTFEKDPPLRPTLTEMEAMPWFGQWASHHEGEFHRPPVENVTYSPSDG
ncbi:Protein kinase domain-containing protein [Aspergillus candidus]|uniref:EKC/KEOPS complex subunit BUD32 n=1 Tax=Aspergillus candidus TaxID=41067 RepID=A0A2I2FBK9_ASPCN|nr:protein kinase-like protein [Aspergillus candidus]PLB38021.1 protein kinase-like protein [Aspergillus candidus]